MNHIVRSLIRTAPSNVRPFTSTKQRFNNAYEKLKKTQEKYAFEEHPSYNRKTPMDMFLYYTAATLTLASFAMSMQVAYRVYYK